MKISRHDPFRDEAAFSQERPKPLSWHGAEGCPQWRRERAPNHCMG